MIDVHTHTYPDKIVKKVVQRMEQAAGTRYKNDATPAGLVKSMESAGVEYSVVLPVATNPGQVGKLNAQAVQLKERYGECGLLAFGAIHPDTEAPREVLRGIRQAGLKGIKIHPDYQDTYFDDIRYLRILDAAAEFGLVVLTHAGVDEMYPDHVHCDVKRMVKVIETLEGGHLILAHMGGWQLWEDVKKYICGAPVYFDTAFSLSGTVSVENNGVFGAMLDDARFVDLVRSHGVSNVLFGSDSPWSSQKENIEWIQSCSLTETEKKMIFDENARKLLLDKGKNM